MFQIEECTLLLPSSLQPFFDAQKAFVYVFASVEFSWVPGTCSYNFCGIHTLIYACTHAYMCMCMCMYM